MGLLRELAKVKAETQNFMRAIRAGVAVEAIRAELSACERRQRDLEMRLAALQSAGSRQPADRLDEYEQVLEDLRRLAETDVIAARERIKALVGEIRLVNYDGEIVALMTGDMLGLLSLTADRSDLLLFREDANGCRGALGKFRGDQLSRVVTARDDRAPADPEGGEDPSGGPAGGGMLEPTKSHPDLNLHPRASLLLSLMPFRRSMTGGNDGGSPASGRFRVGW